MPSAMTVDDLRTYVRDYLDSDSTELPDSLLDVWREEATSRVIRTFEPWSHFRSSWTWTTSASSSALGNIDSTIESVTSVEAPNWMLQYKPHESMVAKYAWGSMTGPPVEWSLDGDTIYLWPAPTDSADYILRGYRQVVDASADTDEPDVPNEFHSLIAEYMLARAYEQQDDEVMSSQKFNRFEAELHSYKARYTRTPSAGIQTIGRQSEAGPILPSRQLFDWE